MTSFADRKSAYLRGSTKAIKEWVRLGLDPEQAVDIFGVIERSRVWLLFEPLDHLYGMFQRDGATAGIALHSGHPLSVQRFTAGHEYGHYALGHQFSQDSIEELYGADSPVQELEAQAFAAEFLMPLALVNRAQDRLDLPRVSQELTPMQAYQLSLELGSSYTATIQHLKQLRKITAHQFDELGKWKPIDLKVQLGRGAKPANARADVWDISDRRRDQHLLLRLDDELHLRLPEVPSSGYRWEVQDCEATGALELVRDELDADSRASDEQIGGSTRRHFWWKAVAPGNGRLNLRLVRQWEGGAARPADEVELSISVESPRTGLDAPSGVSQSQRRAMLQNAA